MDVILHIGSTYEALQIADQIIHTDSCRDDGSVATPVLRELIAWPARAGRASEDSGVRPLYPVRSASPALREEDKQRLTVTLGRK